MSWPTKEVAEDTPWSSLNRIDHAMSCWLPWSGEQVGNLAEEHTERRLGCASMHVGLNVAAPASSKCRGNGSLVLSDGEKIESMDIQDRNSRKWFLHHVN